MYANRMNNDMAVSPIVATLVLIVVAVIGAVAVGTIMGTFSTDVSKQANTGEIAGQASTEILVAGSTTVQPASEAWAKDFMKINPSIKVSVQGGGTGTGVTSAGMGIVDIGAGSRALKDEEKASYPDLKEWQVGGSAVVVIVRGDATPTTATQTELKAAFPDVGEPTYITSLTSIAHSYQRAEASGTEETFAKEYLGYKTNASLDHATNVTGVTGNAGMITAIKGGSDRIGFVDYGYAKAAEGTTSSTVKMLSIDGVKPDSTSIKAALKDTFKGTTTTGAYSKSLARGLYYFTNGEPSSVVKNFITYAQSPEGGARIEEDDIGYFSLGTIFGA
jgi:phosphate transport system substrate-binding protein